MIPAVAVVAAALMISQLDAQSDPATDSSPGPRSGLSPTQAIILGFVEGATEFLPISSTGHLLIVEHLLGMDGDAAQKQAADSLAIVIQAGAILAVLVLYYRRIGQMLQGIAGRSPEGLSLLVNLIVAFLPAAVIGLLFNRWIKEHLFGVMPVASALFVGGVLIVLQSVRSKTPDDQGKELPQLCWRAALFIGVMQCLAFWPGFSRSLATILGGRWARLKMMAAVEFSFLLGLVTLSAATAYETLKHGKEIIASFGVEMPALAFVVAFIAAVISIKFMISALTRFGLLPWGIYRIILAILCVLAL